MSCNQCQCGANVFGPRQAQQDLRRYQRKGADKLTRMLLDALAAEGVHGLTLLDIGGGIGAIPFELLKRGVTAATEIDASPAYVAAAQTEAARQGVADRVACRGGDFVAQAGEIAAAGIVTLNRVICCYPDMPALVGQSAAKAIRLYAAVLPRDTWWVRSIAAVANPLLLLLRMPFHFYVHATAAVDGVLRGSGLVRRVQRDAGFWQLVIYARSA